MEGARNLIDQTVLVKLKSNEGLEFAGIPDEGPFFCKVVGVDQTGIWVENKNFLTIELSDSRGRIIPEEKRETERHIVNLLLPWKDIKTVVMFTDRDAASIAKGVIGEDEEGRGHIGFLG
jgi:hypothetical protein